MESSPLNLAHDHARAASVATQSSDTPVAIIEHALAAGEFAKAANGSGSAEALRTLKLLEAHHLKLSELLRYPSGHPPTEIQQASEKPLSTSAAVAELRASKSDLGPRSSSPLRNPPSLAAPRRPLPRDLSSSIASNLASARGIRANHTRQPLSPSVSTQQAPGSLEAHPRKKSKVPGSIPEHAQPSWVPPTSASQKNVESPSSIPDDPAPVAANDEGFSRFYNTFENIISKLSAPLAFAGLPLVSEEPSDPPTEPATNPRRRLQARRDSDPDLTKYISRAALLATSVDGQSANDSFCVVPTTGHTLSYAHILSFDEKQKRRLAASSHSENTDLFTDPNEEDDFVDARETPMPPTPSSFSRESSRTSTRAKAPRGRDLEKKVEELGIENQSLKEVIDKLSKRLASFEAAAQSNGMALQESMRWMRDMSPARDPISQQNQNNQSINQTEKGLKQRVVELEEMVGLGGKEIEKLGRENDKLKLVLNKYRDRWEKLKEGAKTRRSDGGAGNAGNGSKEAPDRRDGDPANGRFLAG